jgi:predicted phosphoribosyltransferase
MLKASLFHVYTHQNWGNDDLFDSLTKKFQFKFKDRVSAASILGESLKDRIKTKQEQQNALVLGIPRGGVITADIVAKRLSTDKFDIIIARKLTDIDNKEQAIGAVMEDGTTYLDRELVKELSIPDDYIEKEKAYQIEEIKRRSSLFRRQRLDYNKINDKTTILVDDGAASGATLIVAAKWIRRKYNPKLLIIAVPVASKDTVKLLKQEADAIEVITTPSSTFTSVSQYYQIFDQVSEEQVITIMQNRGLLS